MSKRQCEIECNSQAECTSKGCLTNMFSPKKRNNLLCSRSFRDGKDVSIQVSGERPTKNKRPVTICLAQCNKSKKSPSLTPSLIAICASPVGQMSPSSSSDGPTRINEYIYLGSQIDASSESTIKVSHILFFRVTDVFVILSSHDEVMHSIL